MISRTYNTDEKVETWEFQYDTAHETCAAFQQEDTLDNLLKTVRRLKRRKVRNLTITVIQD